MRKILTIILSSITCTMAMAYDLAVIMEVENTHERLEGIPVYATTREGKFIAGSTYSAADSVYIIRDLPDTPLHVRFELGGNQYAEDVSEPMDSITITIQAEMLAHNLREVAVEADRQFFTEREACRHTGQAGQKNI